MKIAIFTDTYHPDMNGVARTLKRLSDYLDGQNITCKIFAPKSPSEYVADNLHQFASLSLFLYPECRLAFPNLINVKTELERFSPDLIHVATPFNIGFCGAYFAKKMNIPLVGSYHTDFDQYLNYYNLEFLSNYLWKYMAWFHKPFQKLYVPSLETLNQLQQRGFSNLELWGRGVDCSLFHPNYNKLSGRMRYHAGNKVIFSYAGRLAPEKDLNTLMTVATSLPEAIQEKIQWIIVGDGPEREELEAQAPRNMLFTGYLKGEKLAEVYSISDVFVFPSPTETFGNVVLEALASGTPVVCANSGGVKHLVKDGISGFLCEPGNPESFKKALLTLMNNPALLRSMGQQGRNFALTQKWDTVLASLVWSYRDVIETRVERKYA
ncbi:glycosyl transferase [Bacillus sp. FJAT-18017]|uniref:glycosyltransferase family 4 protein n=1 Tax=Bacillus sp. FJAT-18017 TaxID=1705566 RepID=UPI0006AFE876|nr:glycosyltransferase family 1 protein [Bacillus sp. FJAT-18017]ALC91652.1 glycosyl transferase [Bacillus sp. FJAT-18017]